MFQPGKMRWICLGSICSTSAISARLGDSSERQPARTSLPAMLLVSSADMSRADGQTSPVEWLAVNRTIPERSKGLVRKVLTVAVTVLLLLGAMAWLASRLSDRLVIGQYAPPGRMVSVGDRRLHLFCTGNTGPAVIIEQGIGSGWQTWSTVVGELASFSRPCVYDRAGYGWSDPQTGPADASSLAGDLDLLLRNAGV